MRLSTRGIIALGVPCFIGGLLLLGGTGSQTLSPSNQGNGRPIVPALGKVQLADAYGKLPLYFEPNQGQTDPRVKFLSRGRGYTLFLTLNEAVLVLQKTASQPVLARPFDHPERSKVSAAAFPGSQTTQQNENGVILRMKLTGANPHPHAIGQNELPGKANYFIGNDPKKWHTNVPTYASVKYHSVYPGVDLVYYGNQRQLENDFIVAPGADPSSITMSFDGAEKLSLNGQGELVIALKEGEVRFEKPLMYQEVDGVRREITGGYALTGARQVGFEVAAYNATQPLIIDPVLFYSTYLGGSSSDQGTGIAVDTSGNAYVAGSTVSTNFPTTTGTFQNTFAGGEDAFVTKLNPTGSGLVYSTYLGGSGNVGSQVVIAVDTAGNAYIAGADFFGGFPTTLGAAQINFGGGSSDAFVAKLNPTGNALIYSTYLGGNSDDFAHGIAVDAAGNAYVTGNTFSSNFPTTPGAFQTSFGGGIDDAFVTKLNATGTSFVYSTYLGGSDRDIGQDIAVDTFGNAYVTGQTASSNFPTTFGAFQTTFGGGAFPGDVFVTKVNPLGNGLLYSTYVGGNGSDGGIGIAVDAAGSAYVTGQAAGNFPTTPGAFQNAFGGGSSDAFVAKLDSTGSGLVYSTYLGGSGNDVGWRVVADISGNAYVAGYTNSTNFPIANPLQAANAGGFDAFATKVNPLGTGLVYSTYLGGGADDFGFGIAVDDLPNPNAYVTGATGSTNFPTTPGAFQTTFGGGSFDAFVTKIANIVLPPGATSGKVTGGGTVNVSGGIANFGFIVQAQQATGQISGDLQYVNHASGAVVHSVMFMTFTISGNTATFSGTCTNNGAPCTFNVTVQDNDQPPGPDSFVISIDGGTPEGGTLRSGDIQIH